MGEAEGLAGFYLLISILRVSCVVHGDFLFSAFFLAGTAILSSLSCYRYLLHKIGFLGNVVLAKSAKLTDEMAD